MASSEPPVSLLESSTAEQTPPPLRILCFGDSLTCGLSLNVHGFQEDPYSRRLEERLRAAFPDRRITIATDGLPGDMVTIPSFVDRLENAYRRCSEGFDWTIILAGTKWVNTVIGSSANQTYLLTAPCTNSDLPCMTIPMIQAGLTSVWQFAQDHGARVLAMTVPELTHRYHHLDEKRNELNQWIMSQRMDGL